MWYGSAGATGIWQPVDCGYGRLLKSLIQAEQDDWLEKQNNIDLWLGNSENSLDAKKRSIFLTHWVRNVTEKLSAQDSDKIRYRCFEKTGYLITVDGSAEDKVNPEGLKNYVVPPPLPMTEPAEVVACELPEITSHKEVNNDEITERFEQQLDYETENVDYEADRDYTHELDGRTNLKFFKKMVSLLEQYHGTIENCRRFGYNMKKTTQTIIFR